MIAHRQYVPAQLPPIAGQGRGAPEGGETEESRSNAVSRSKFEHYAQTVIEGLERLRFRAWDIGIDFETALREIEAESQRSREFGQRLASELGKLQPVLNSAMISHLQNRPALSETTSSHALQAVLDAQWLLGVNRRVLSAYEDCARNLRDIRDSRLAHYAATWEDYLSRLEQQSPIAAEVRALWSILRDRLWAPEGAPTTDGFRLAWDRGPHHLQIEVFPGGQWDWFYRNRDDENGTQFEEDLAPGQESRALDAVLFRLAAA